MVQWTHLQLLPERVCEEEDEEDEEDEEERGGGGRREQVQMKSIANESTGTVLLSASLGLSCVRIARPGLM